MKVIKKIILSLAIIVLFLNCGKKGPLKLKPLQFPKEVKNLELSQVGNKIKLQWDFPQTLPAGKKKTSFEFDIENIKKIHIYYSNKEILGGKFRKKSTLLQKLKPGDLSLVRKALPLKPLKPLQPLKPQAATQKKQQPTKTKEIKNLSYFVEIPFGINELDNKVHFFGIQYYYLKKKSPISTIAFINTLIPVKPVTGLRAAGENKMIILEWEKPQQDIANNTVDNIAGYNIFRKIEKDEENSEETKEETGFFKKLNKKNVLLEYYEDTDTGSNGTYSYYVSTIISSKIESDPSETVSLQVTDIYPPEVPANLVSFKAQDHMFLTWKGVNDQDLSHYRVYRRVPPVKEFRLIADNIAANYYKDTNVEKDKIYVYTVTSVDQKGNESEPSNKAREQF